MLDTGWIERFARHHRKSRLNHVVATIRLGWDNYSFIFYIGSISAILSQFFGTAGILSVGVTLLFFYYAGRVMGVIKNDEEKERYRRLRSRLKRIRK